MTTRLFSSTIIFFLKKYPMDQRYLLLQAWLKHVLPTDFAITPLAGDASFRRYFRISQGQQTFVAMDAPPTHEDVAPFITIAHALRAHGVVTPRLIDADLTQGFLLLSDLGDMLYLKALNPDTAESLYNRAFQTLHSLQTCALSPLPLFDEGMILRELSLFVEWYLQKHLGLSLKTQDQKILVTAFSHLIQSAQAQPQCFVHRDYHSRNLLVLPEGGVGVLDFQDAVHGPVTYDLVSLIRDCYITWPEADVTRWMQAFQDQATEKKTLPKVSSALFMRWADWMGMQRHLKAIGIFSRLNHRDHKHPYLQDIPRTLNYVYHISEKYPEFSDFKHWLEDHVLEATVALNESEAR